MRSGEKLTRLACGVIGMGLFGAGLWHVAPWMACVAVGVSLMAMAMIGAKA